MPPILSWNWSLARNKKHLKEGMLVRPSELIKNSDIFAIVDKIWLQKQNLYSKFRFRKSIT